MITCFIRYEIDPYKKDAFMEYARNWGQAIPRFAPHEGSVSTAYGIYHLPDLASYEAYRARLKDDHLGRENYEFSRREKFILREKRQFLKIASTPHTELIKP